MPDNPAIKPNPIEILLEKHDKKMRLLFLKVMNMHAGYQVNPRSDNELVAEIRKAIEACCDEAE